MARLERQNFGRTSGIASKAIAEVAPIVSEEEQSRHGRRREETSAARRSVKTT